MSNKPRKKKTKKPARVRNKTFDQWMENVSKRAFNLLYEEYGDMNPDNNKIMVILDVTEATLPKDIWHSNKITQQEVLDYIIPKVYGKDIDYIHYNLTEVVTNEIVRKHPDNYAITSTLKTCGLKKEDVILDIIYDLVEVNVDITGLLEKSSLELVGDIDPSWRINIKRTKPVIEQVFDRFM